MKFRNPLELLIEKSREARDGAGRALAESRRSQKLTAEQLDALKKYRSEYHDKLHAALLRGMDATSLGNYQRFLSSLDDAIGNAGLRLTQNSAKVASNQQHWRQRQKQLSSYDTLASRRATRVRTQAARADQRQSDELSNNTQARERSRKQAAGTKPKEPT